MAVALVVGGASGIGAGCVELLAERGWTVGVVDLRPPEAAPSGMSAFALADVRDRDAVDVAVGEIEGRLGTPTGVVCAAGVARLSPLLEIAAHEWDLVVGVNLLGSFNVLRAGALRLRAAGLPGSLVFVSSVDAQMPVAGLAHYCAAKAGVESLVRVAALELAGLGIRCNAVAPGAVSTPLFQPILDREGVHADFVEHTPLGRVATPPDIARTVEFLLSEDAAWVTGQTLKVDGGMSLREHPRILP